MWLNAKLVCYVTLLWCFIRFFSLFNKSQKWSEIVKKLRLTPLFFSGGPFFKIHFLEKYTSHDAQYPIIDSTVAHKCNTQNLNPVHKSQYAKLRTQKSVQKSQYTKSSTQNSVHKSQSTQNPVYKSQYTKPSTQKSVHQTQYTNLPNEVDRQTALDALGWEPLKEQRKKAKAKNNVQNIRRHWAQVSQWSLYFQKRSFEPQSSRQLYYSLFGTTTHKQYEKESYVRRSLHMELPTSKHKRE